MKYQPNLDGIRALGALLVLLFHAKAPGGSSGFLGVDIFFVLSGYLITRLLIDEHLSNGKIEYKSFTIRRIKRLYPALVVLITVYLLTASIIWPDTRITKHVWDAAVVAIYMGDYATAAGSPLAVLSHAWSLGVEEKYYLIWPLAVGLAMKMNRGHACLTIACAFIGITLWRAYNVEQLESFWHVYRRFDTHCSGLLLGSLAAFSNIKLSERWGWVGIASLILILITFNYKTKEVATFGFTAVELASLLIVAGCPAAFGRSILPWLGKMSYGFYLWHYFLIRIGRVYELSWQENLALGGLGGLALAAISYYAVEQWFKSPRPLKACTASR